jgi:fumarate hydratase class I
MNPHESLYRKKIRKPDKEIKMVDFSYQEMFPLGEDATEYRLLSQEHISITSFEGKEMIKIQPEALTLLVETAFRDVAHLLRPAHLEKVAAILKDPEASKNDRLVALEMLKNAVISAEMEFPMCQDTGTAIVMGKKGQQVWADFNESEAISKGVYNAYVQNNLRYSQNAPLSMFEEKNTGCNLPAQIDLYATPGDAYKFLFVAKGGGSGNKVYLYQETKAVLNPDALKKFVLEKMKTLGTAACPPYHLAFVIGGTSAELNLKTVKLASAGYLDNLPTTGSEGGRAFRDMEWEEKILKMSQETGIGAQFGGKYFCLDVRVIRMPRHGASCPIGMGVSCSADRNIKGKITREGIFLEQLETDPAKYLPSLHSAFEDAVRIDLNQPMDDIRAILTKYPVATPLLLTGKIVVGRDIAHAKLKERLDRGEDLPDYIKDHIIYYAGPAKTPEGYASGSFGPTTAARMDPYVPIFQARGGSMVMLAKGNRSQTGDRCLQRVRGILSGFHRRPGRTPGERVHYPYESAGVS